MLLTFKTMSTEQMYRMVHSVYAEASYAVAKETHPEAEDLSQAIEEAERYYVEKFLGKFMSQNENSYYVWEEDGAWVSALRLTKKQDFYFMEALETAPEHRNKGYAAALIKAVIEQLESEGRTVIRSNVRKTNAVSLATHKKCGFLIEKVNETKDYFYDMLYVGKEE